VLARHLDRDRPGGDLHRLTVIAVDGGIPAQTGSLDVSIVVLDANDRPDNDGDDDDDDDVREYWNPDPCRGSSWLSTPTRSLRMMMMMMMMMM